VPLSSTRLPRATKLQPMPTHTKSLVKPFMSNLASQKLMHMAETVILDVAVLTISEVVVDSKTDKDPRVDEETLEDRTVVGEVLQLLEEVGARVRQQMHDLRNLFPRSEKRRPHSSCYPFSDFGDVPYKLWTTVFFLLHETQDLVLYLLSSTAVLPTACILVTHLPSSFIAIFLRRKEKFSGMISRNG